MPAIKKYNKFILEIEETLSRYIDKFLFPKDIIILRVPNRLDCTKVCLLVCLSVCLSCLVPRHLQGRVPHPLRVVLEYTKSVISVLPYLSSVKSVTYSGGLACSLGLHMASLAWGVQREGVWQRTNWEGMWSVCLHLCKKCIELSFVGLERYRQT